MKRYSILVMEEDREIELCQCDNGATELARVLTKKMLGHGKERIQKYKSVRVVDNGDRLGA